MRELLNMKEIFCSTLLKAQKSIILAKDIYILESKYIPKKI